jgi:hypothetical protein
MENFFIESVLALLAVIMGVDFDTQLVNEVAGAWVYPSIIDGALEGAARKAARNAARTKRNRRSDGSKTRAGNIASAAARAARNVARKAASAAVAAKYGHSAREVVTARRKAVVAAIAATGSHACGIKAAKRAKRGTGFKARDVRRNVYTHRLAAEVYVPKAKVAAVKAATPAARKLTAEAVKTAGEILRMVKRAEKARAHLVWVAAQDGGVVTKAGAARVAALSKKAALAASDFEAVYGLSANAAALTSRSLRAALKVAA